MLSDGEGLHEFRSAPATLPQKKLSIQKVTGSNSRDYNGCGSNFNIRTQIYTWTGRGEDETPFNMFTINILGHLGGLSGK